MAIVLDIHGDVIADPMLLSLESLVSRPILVGRVGVLHWDEALSSMVMLRLNHLDPPPLTLEQVKIEWVLSEMRLDILLGDSRSSSLGLVLEALLGKGPNIIREWVDQASLVDLVYPQEDSTFSKTALVSGLKGIHSRIVMEGGASEVKSVITAAENVNRMVNYATPEQVVMSGRK